MKSALLYKQLLDNLSTAVLLLDTEFKVEYINPAAENLFNSSASRMESVPIYSFFAYPERTKKALGRMMRANQSFTQRRVEMNLPAGEVVHIDFTCTPVNEPRHGLLIELTPVDRLMQINREEALLSAHSTSRNLIRGLAHEIKNPLGGIRGATQLLAQELASDSDMTEYTEIISYEVTRLCNLVDRLLGPSKLPNIKSLNIHEVTEHVAALIEAESAKKVRISRDYDPSIPELLADKEQLIQAVLNIARNALQSLTENRIANPEISFRTRIQRNFTIGAEHHKHLCCLDIIDNGPGVPDEISDRIFFPMITSRAEGTGLGLPMAQSAISLHHGLIKHQRENDKTCFSIYLPLENMSHDK